MDYAERLTVPLRWWAQGTMLVASLWLAVLVATDEVGEWSPGPWPGSRWRSWWRCSSATAAPRVGVEGDTLRAGRAHIALEHVGEVTALDADGVRRLAGVDADARAYLLLRPYLKRGVRIDITDPADPAPYWLVSCRRPEALVTAVGVGRTAGRSG